MSPMFGILLLVLPQQPCNTFIHWAVGWIPVVNKRFISQYFFIGQIFNHKLLIRERTLIIKELEINKEVKERIQEPVDCYLYYLIPTSYETVIELYYDRIRIRTKKKENLMRARTVPSWVFLRYRNLVHRWWNNNQIIIGELVKRLSYSIWEVSL